jgi:hypothetical protein
MMTNLDAFKDKIERFLTESGMTATAFGKTSLNDPNFVFDLRGGRVPNLAIVDRVEQFIGSRPSQEESSTMFDGEAA